MRRGATDTLTLNVPIDLTAATTMRVIIQDLHGNTVVKTGDELQVTSHQIVVHLTQEDTYSLHGNRAVIQLHYKISDEVDWSNEKEVNLKQVLEEVIL